MFKLLCSLLTLVGVFCGSISASAANCTYELQKNSVVVGWTAFKTTQKTGVNGSFKTVVVAGKTEAKSLSDLIKGLTVSVDKASVDTGNPARDKTLSDFFFSKLGNNISGKVKDLSEKDHSFHLALDFNGQKKDIAMKYDSKMEENFAATGSLDITQFGGTEALSSLNAKCLDLHKGADGISKTWPEVVLNLTATIKKICQ